MPIDHIKTKELFAAQLKACKSLMVFHFMADWAPQCKQMNEVLEELSNQDDIVDTTFFKIIAEDIPEVCSKYEVTAVPTFLIFREEDLVDRVDGANAAELTAKIKAQIAKFSLFSTAPTSREDTLKVHLKKLINSYKCMLFMKGSPNQPKCGFSKTTVELLNKYNADYKHFDILSNEEIRAGLKSYSNWPTYPQLYIDGELIGGLDILKEMDESKELTNILPQKISLEDKLKALINKSELMVFMKGTPTEPRCGFSKQLMGILNEVGLEFKTFDILSDEEVRQELKKFSNWPTYPQIYVKGELIGGLDIIKDHQADGSLLSVLKGE